ncbi:MAG: 2-oxoacid:acceptor oxidoreductase subunit alpha [Crenarchaeota archaeon]|nr:2-oxoacid:acceptor oxidoreductase subunit alpha [Thermoproteota archaeon]
MSKNLLQITIGGPAGFGILRSGWLLGKAFSLIGLNVAAISEYPSRIEGGHNYVDVCISKDPVGSKQPKSDVVVALDDLAVDRHIGRLEDDGILIYDSSIVKKELKGDRFAGLPFTRVARERGFDEITRNTMALGATLYSLGMDVQPLKVAISKAFGKKEVVEMNLKALEVGLELMREVYPGLKINTPIEILKANGDPKYFISGNEAVAVGAMAAGLTVYVAYPITPISPLLHYLVTKQEHGLLAYQLESEIAAILTGLGASYAGARVLVGTSGPGFSLMAESLGFAGMAEIPIVIVLAQRYGPSTGLPTHTGQGDLRFAMHASQGEFPRFIVAPGDVRETIYYTQVLLNLTEKFQVPGIILIDRCLAESYFTFDDIDGLEVDIDRGKIVEEVKGKYKRYEITDDGVSPLAFPGTPNAVVRINSHEHDEEGISSEDPKVAVSMSDKRLRKLKFMREEIKKYTPVKVYGDKESKNAIIFWGSVKGPVLDAYRLLERDGISCRLVQILFFSPFPDSEVLDSLKGAEMIISVENNATSQLVSVLREFVGVSVSYRVNKYDGRPFTPIDVYEAVMKVMRK